VTQPATPPLIFDDPFVTFDDDRARRALALIKDISREHQVIFLTTSDRYDAMADKVIELPAPTEQDEAELVAAAAGPAETLSVWSTSLLPPVVPKSERGNGNGNGSGDVATPKPGEPAQRRRETADDSAEVKVEAAPLWPVEDR
jgi:hypothetical protein